MVPGPEDEGRHPSPYLNDLEEWGERQYSPGHWTGGRLPPYLKYAQRPLVLIILIAASFTAVAFLSAMASSRGWDRLMYIVPLAVSATLALGSAVRLFRRRPQRRETKHRSRPVR